MSRHARRSGRLLAIVVSATLLVALMGYCLIHLSPQAEAAQGQAAVSSSVVPGSAPAAATTGRVHVASAGQTCQSCHQWEATGVDMSVHKDVSCTSCHWRLPDGSLARGDETCSTCHKDVYTVYRDSAHRLAEQDVLTCVGCHGSHVVRKPTVADGTASCATCHQQENRTYASDIHAPSGGGKPAATCTDCHDPHAVRPAPEGALAPSDLAYASRQCSSCHTASAKEVQQSVHASLPGTCTTCHSGYHDPKNTGDVLQVAASSCVTCHEDARASYLTGAHGQGAGRDITCTQCHGTHDVKSPVTTATQATLAQACDTCHADMAGSLKASAHGQGAGVTCLSCHGVHGSTTTTSNATTSAREANALCLGCHQDAAADFQASKHGPAGVSCVACHDPHTTPTATSGGGHDLAASVSASCVDCHRQEATALAVSVHGGATCAACHGGATGTGDTQTAAQAASAPATGVHQALTDLKGLDQPQACLGCHTNITRSWNVSIHGVAYSLGSQRAPTCITCHGVHDILAPGDPGSRVSTANVSRTCATCHTGATAAMARGPEHFVPQERSSGVVFWVWVFFIGLILFDVAKDGPIVIMELWRRFREHD